MTEEQIKENIKYTLQRTTYAPTTENLDLIFKDEIYDKVLNRNGKTRHIHSGQYVELQLKATEEHRIVYKDDHLKYDLEAKAYNDLIDRFNDGTAPLVLVLAILPDDRNDWVNVGGSSLILNQRVYYFYPQDGMETTPNTSSVRIDVPFNNKIGMDFFKNLFDEHYQ